MYVLPVSAAAEPALATGDKAVFAAMRVLPASAATEPALAAEDPELEGGTEGEQAHSAQRAQSVSL